MNGWNQIHTFFFSLLFLLAIRSKCISVSVKFLCEHIFCHSSHVHTLHYYYIILYMLVACLHIGIVVHSVMVFCLLTFRFFSIHLIPPPLSLFFLSPLMLIVFIDMREKKRAHLPHNTSQSEKRVIWFFRYFHIFFYLWAGWIFWLNGQTFLVRCTVYIMIMLYQSMPIIFNTIIIIVVVVGD